MQSHLERSVCPEGPQGRSEQGLRPARVGRVPQVKPSVDAVPSSDELVTEEIVYLFDTPMHLGFVGFLSYKQVVGFGGVWIWGAE